MSNNERICRICLDSDNQNELISPCRCKGTSEFVHRECIMNWININDTENIENTRRCNQCTYNYKFKEHKIKNKYLNFLCITTLNNKFLSFLLNLITLLFFSLVNYLFGIYSLIEKNFYIINYFKEFGIILSSSLSYSIISSLILFNIVCITKCCPNKLPEYSYLRVTHMHMINIMFLSSLMKCFHS